MTPDELVLTYFSWGERDWCNGNNYYYNQLYSDCSILLVLFNCIKITFRSVVHLVRANCLTLYHFACTLWHVSVFFRYHEIANKYTLSGLIKAFWFASYHRDLIFTFSGQSKSTFTTASKLIQKALIKWSLDYLDVGSQIVRL